MNQNYPEAKIPKEAELFIYEIQMLIKLCEYETVRHECDSNFIIADNFKIMQGKLQTQMNAFDRTNKR